MSHFDYYLTYPERAVMFTASGWKLTPMAENAILLDSTARAMNAEGDFASKQEMRIGLEKAMRVRLHQAILSHIESEYQLGGLNLSVSPV